MNENIELQINVRIFKLMCIIWVLLCIGMCIPGYALAPELKTLYGIITGSLLTIFTAFSKKISGETPNSPGGE